MNDRNDGKTDYWMRLLALVALLSYQSQTQGEIKEPVVLIRHPSASLKNYYVTVQLNPQYLTPMQAYRDRLEKNDLAQSLMLETSKLIRSHETKSGNQESLSSFFTQHYESYHSYNLFSLLESTQQQLHFTFEDISEQTAQDIDEHLRRLRQKPGGEDVTLFINGAPWDEIRNRESWPPYQNWSLVSSAWAICSRSGSVAELKQWLSSLVSCPFWIEGNREDYRWSRLGFTKNYHRAIYWEDQLITPDNWFYPLQEKSHHYTQTQSHDQKWWVWVGGGLLLSLLLLSVSDYQLVMEY